MDTIVIDIGAVDVTYPYVGNGIVIEGDDAQIEIIQLGEAIVPQVVGYQVGPKGADGTLTDDLLVARDATYEARDAALQASEDAVAAAESTAGSVQAAEQAKTDAETAASAADASATISDQARAATVQAIADFDVIKTAAVTELTTLKTDTIAAVTETADAASLAINTAKTDATGAIETLASDTVTQVTTLKTDATTAINTTKIDAISEIGTIKTSAADEIATLKADAVAEVGAIRDATSQIKTDTATIRDQAASARSDAIGAKTQSEAARDAAQNAKTSVDTAKGAVDTALADTIAARDAAEDFMERAEAAAQEAEAVQPESVAYLRREKPPAGTSLDDVKLRGVYFFNVANDVTLGLKFPANGRTGRLIVDVSDDAQKYFQQYKDDNNWQSWTRISVNAGASWSSWYIDYNSGSLGAVSQAVAEAGTASTLYTWSPIRVAQAIAAQAASKIHTHSVEDITGLIQLLAEKASLAAPAFVGNATVETPDAVDNSKRMANTEWVLARIDDLIAGAPGALNTFKELADAMGDDPNFAQTVINALAQKAPLVHDHQMSDIVGLMAALDLLASKDSPNFIGKPTAPSAPYDDNSNQIATTAHVKSAIANSGLSTEGHQHEIEDVNGLEDALAGKAALNHTHTAAQITDLQPLLDEKASLDSPAFEGTPTTQTAPVGSNDDTVSNTAFVQRELSNALAGKADIDHTHEMADVDGLVTALEGKSAVGHQHTTADISDFTTKFSQKLDASAYSAADVLAKLKTVDGAGSGLDADLLDGMAPADLPLSTAVQAALGAKFDKSGGTLTGEVITSSANGYRIIYGDYGVFLRNYNSKFYLLATAALDQAGTYNAFRPLTVDLSTGYVTLSQTTVNGDLTATGDITAFSDARLKSDVETIENALDMVNRMRGVRFTMNGKRGIGVIAQEVQAVAPELVVETGNEEGHLAVAYGNTIGILIEAIKELREEIRALKGE